MMDAQEAEGKMAIQDRIMRETADAMNELESKVYSIRDNLSMRFSAYATDAEKETLTGKLKELMDLYTPIVEREREATERPDAISALRTALEKFAAFAASDAEEYSHISAEDKSKVGGECATATAWLAEMEGKLAGMSTSSEPPFKASELVAKL